MPIKLFSQISKEDAVTTGGKGASLGEMTQAGIPVPPGFVILASAFERFLGETNLNTEIDTVLHSVDQREMSTVENASERIQALILNATMPEDIAATIQECYAKLDAQFVAVRSSATAEDSAGAAWAGQLDSYLKTTEDTLLANVQKCWASLFTPRAIFYRFEKELHTQKISVAVVVQKMVQSEVSGIAFSVHPVTEDYNQLIIEAGFGLGEAIVSGAVTPDSYVIEKEPRRILDKSITYQSRALWRAENGGNEWRELSEVEGNKPALSDEQALALAEIILRIENHYGFPCDIEWAYEAGQFFITQSRPITTLAPKANVSTNRPLYKKTFTRNFTLVVIEVWERAETLSAKPWTQERFPFTPYIVFEHNEKGVSAFFDEQGIQWIKRHLVTEAQKNPDFIARIEKELQETYATIQNSWSRSALSQEELIEFLKNLENCWVWFEAGWWLWETTLEEREGLIIPKSLYDIRERTQNLVTESERLVRNSLEHLFPTVKKYAEVISGAEIISGRLPNVDVLEARQQHYILSNGELLLTVGYKEIESRFDIEIEEPLIEATDSLTGQVGYAGKVRGIVRTVYGTKHMDKVQKGDVLVAPMTLPDILPAMKRAAAFVTDEGGIGCHAIIAAREMKKPCIIGTKFATRVLRDGDLVEVDAEKGIVRILKQAEK